MMGVPNYGATTAKAASSCSACSTTATSAGRSSRSTDDEVAALRAGLEASRLL